MITAAGSWRWTLALVAGGVLAAGSAIAQYEESSSEPGDFRSEVWLAVAGWPALSGLETTVGGSFDDVGFGFGAAVHWTYRETENAELMLGVEGAVMATESNIPVRLDDFLARHLYVAASAKYLVGRARNLSLDAGLGYHLVDIAQLETDYYYSEFESWEEDAFGPFVGFTWDAGANDSYDGNGLTLGFRVHFIDLGTVRDEDVFGSAILGRDAGDLDGPKYALRIGYRWR